ncbi:hypothetical protein ACO0LM_11815 [Undibacterium sp. Di26W]|uniref:hypothetical protein n=1 Tax=Undibacterium sp. Di26W TaxID=3413035 RepID=UPI003BF36B4E
MTDTTVKYFHDGMAGAPILNGVAGSLIDVLDAVLVNGWGVASVGTIVVVDNVATMTISVGHSFVPGAVALIAGATPSGLNGEYRIASTTTTTATFATTGISNQTATGTITAKVASAGWTKAFSGTNLAAYKSADSTSTMAYLRVDDTGTTSARVVGYTDMTAISTGTNPFPTSAQQSGGLYWSKSEAASSTARKWVIFADGKTLYFNRFNSSSNTLACEMSMFGDLASVSASGDAFGCMLTGCANEKSNGSAATVDQNFYSSIAPATAYIAKAYNGIGDAIQAIRTFPTALANGVSNYSGQVTGPNATPYPNPTDNGLYLVLFNISENDSKAFRGFMRGMYAVAQSMPTTTFATHDSVSGVANFPGRVMKAITAKNTSTSVYGTVFFDITGPWG